MLICFSAVLSGLGSHSRSLFMSHKGTYSRRFVRFHCNTQEIFIKFSTNLNDIVLKILESSTMADPIEVYESSGFCYKKDDWWSLFSAIGT